MTWSGAGIKQQYFVYFHFGLLVSLSCYSNAHVIEVVSSPFYVLRMQIDANRIRNRNILWKESEITWRNSVSTWQLRNKKRVFHWLAYTSLLKWSRMEWSRNQQAQLAAEKSRIEKYFPNGQIRWNNPNSLYYAWVQITMNSNSNKLYTLRIYIPSDFPNSCPDMVMVSPSDLRQRNGAALPHESSVFHTIGERDGYIKICHTRPALWTQTWLYEIFLKGRLWIEAYEGHLATGNNMDVYLKHQRKRYESDDPRCIIS